MKIERFVVPPGGKKFDLQKASTKDTHGVKDKAEAKELLAKRVKRLAEIQDVLYADDRFGILLIFQAMDAAGKDGTIKHVMSGVNPQGCQVFSFKAPSAEDLDHDFMWRTMKCMPEQGRIGIFNRSYYEEVLVVRVHPEFLDAQKLPPQALDDIWDTRFEDINAIEKYLVRNGILPIKLFLHVSKEEQLKRFIARLDDPTKNWKFSSADVSERKLWDKYQDAYAEMLRHTSTKAAPWYVIPADNKWYTRLAVIEVIISRLEQLDLHYPKVSDDKRAELAKIREQLAAEE